MDDVSLPARAVASRKSRPDFSRSRGGRLCIPASKHKTNTWLWRGVCEECKESSFIRIPPLAALHRSCTCQGNYPRGPRYCQKAARHCACQSLGPRTSLASAHVFVGRAIIVLIRHIAIRAAQVRQPFLLAHHSAALAFRHR